MLAAFAFEMIMNGLKVLETKVDTWNKAFFTSIPLFITAKTSWLFIGAPSIILNGFHFHHFEYGLLILSYSIFSKFFEKYRVFQNYKLLMTFSSILVLDGLTATFLVAGSHF